MGELGFEMGHGGRLSMRAASRQRGVAAAMIAEPLPAEALGGVAVDLPRLTELAPGAQVAGALSFMVHGRFHF